MCHRKPVEHPGVAGPITARQGRPHVTYVEACLEYLCVAEVVYFPVNEVINSHKGEVKLNTKMCEYYRFTK